MGLDIYLYKHKNLEKKKEAEEAFEKESTAIWDEIYEGKYDSLSKEEKDQRYQLYKERKKPLAEKYGTDEDGTYLEEEGDGCVELDSKKYPEHYFKIGYFRSSYNDSGINRILHSMFGKDLYWLFDAGDEYIFKPDWKEAKEKIKWLREEFSKKLSEGRTFRAMEVRHNQFMKASDLPKGEEEALDIFYKEFDRNRDGEGAYSNSKGEFYIQEPLKVYGIITGKNKMFFSETDTPCVYLICKNEDLKYYSEALEIIEETIDHVLGQDDMDIYHLHWSG